MFLGANPCGGRMATKSSSGVVAWIVFAAVLGWAILHLKYPEKFPSLVVENWSSADQAGSGMLPGSVWPVP